MSFPEIIYRSNQQVQKQLEKKGFYKISHHRQDYELVLAQSKSTIVDKIPDRLAESFRHYDTLAFFTYALDITGTIDWHLDISSGKRFPLLFAKDIDIRSGKFGSAKVVWEINRLQFLLPLAVKYTLTRNEADLQHWMDLMQDWTKANPYLKGINWYSNIEVNIRLIVWYFCWQVLWSDEAVQQNKAFHQFAKTCWLPAIYEHCVYSHSNPSKYSSANNHLVSEYAGLFVAASCWPFAESARWKQYAQKGLQKEMVLQHSRNGINKEQAAEYIQFITDFFLIPYAIGVQTGTAFSDEYRQYLSNIATYISVLLDAKEGYRKYGDEDDGKVLITSTDQHFNNFSSILTSAAILFRDSAFKPASTAIDLKNWLLFGVDGAATFQSLKPNTALAQSRLYEEEGQFFFKKADPENTSKEIYLHLDAAPLGFLSIAAHGHADALSIALHVDGLPFIADAGTFTYHTDREWRNYFISTAAHNTVCIDRKNQAMQAGPTMWLDHYQISHVQAAVTGAIETVSAMHSGYRQLGCEHRRTVVFDRNNDMFTITDEIGTDGHAHELLLPWHLHPEVEVEVAGRHEQSFTLRHPQTDRCVVITCDVQLQTTVVNGQTAPLMGWFSASFLKKEPTSVIAGSMTTSSSKKYVFITKIKIQ